MAVPVMRDAFQAEGLAKLCKWANQNGAVGKCVEIGSYSGEGTVVLADHFKEVLAVDPWENGYDPNDVASHQCPMEDVFNAFTERTKVKGNINFSRGKSLDALEFVADGSLDLVYVDGDHRYEGALADIKGWLPKLRKGGCMTGHDFSFPTVRQALSETFKGDYLALFQGDSWGYIV
jgi:predicted O-methyltransferase YrrM